MKTSVNGAWVVAVLCAVLSSCSSDQREVKSPYAPGHFEKQIAILTQADVAVDVASAVAKGDQRFLLNVGVGGSIPGVANWSDEMRRKYGTRILDGTGDMVFGPEQEEYKRVADVYARKYNQLLLAQISNAANAPQ